MKKFALKLFSCGDLDVGIAGAKDSYPTKADFISAIKNHWKEKFGNKDIKEKDIIDTRCAFRKTPEWEEFFPNGNFIITDDTDPDTFPIWAWSIDE